MTDGELGAGVSQARGEQVLRLAAAQLGVRNLGVPPDEVVGSRFRLYRSNYDLWDSLLDERLRPTENVMLEDFWLSEWFPLRPGLFHTRRGSQNRSMAQRHLLVGPGTSGKNLLEFQERFGRRISSRTYERLKREKAFVYDPYGKTYMLDGGVGCVRLKCKQTTAGQVWFMGASSTPIAHEGVPVALPDQLYAQFIERIAAEGSFRCTITGRVTQIPDDFDPLYRDLVGIPQVYIYVEGLQPSDLEVRIPFLSTGAVMIETKSSGQPPRATWDLSDGIYAAFVSFLPGKSNAIRNAAEWLQDIYVHELLGGRVLTDFDEQVRRFDGTTFGLDQVASGRVSAMDAQRCLDRCGASSHERHRFIERVEVVNGDVWNIAGDAIVASRGGVAAGTGGAAAGSGGAAATGMSAAATHGASAAAGRSSANVGFTSRARASRWAQSFGVTAVIATVVATTLLILDITDIAIAGYVLAVIAVIVGVIPLFSK
jgi:hypothetical protein